MENPSRRQGLLREVRSEGSRSAKSGADEQEDDIRPSSGGEIAGNIDAQ